MLMPMKHNCVMKHVIRWNQLKQIMKQSHVLMVHLFETDFNFYVKCYTNCAIKSNRFKYNSILFPVSNDKYIFMHKFTTHF